MKSLPAPGAAPVTAPAQGQISNHLLASQMAHAAAKRAAVSKVLSGGGSASTAALAPPKNSFKSHVLAVAGMPNGTTAHVHSAIDQAVSGGAFTPGQGAALKAHNGPLQGAAGAQTIATLGTTLANMKGSV